MRKIGGLVFWKFAGFGGSFYVQKTPGNMLEYVQSFAAGIVIGLIGFGLVF